MNNKNNKVKQNSKLNWRYVDMPHPLSGPYDNSRNDEFLDDLVKRSGPIRDRFTLPEHTLSQYTDKMPEIVPQLWQREGLGSVLNKMLWLCNPDDFKPVVNTLLAGDPDFDPGKTHVYAYSVFGTLIAWNEDYWNVEINLLFGTMKCKGLLYPEKKRNTNLSFFSTFYHFEKEDLDAEDEDGKWLYTRAKKRLGALEYGECYGFFPALPLGGPCRVENLKKVKAVEHFAMLAQMQDFVLMDYLSRPILEVRLIGG